MFKTVLTLFRGSVAAAGEELEDRSALLILDQQMRDAAAAVERSKRTLALAIAGDQQEGRRLDATNARIADLETRATAALDGGREDLAREAAQAIANLEADRDAAMTARTLFASEITRMKRQVAGAEARITELDRGRRIARASEAVRAMRRGGVEAARPYESTLPEAENTLKRLRERQMEAQAADEAFSELDAASGPLATAEKLAEQGFGPRLKSTADDVLARLNAKRTQSKLPETETDPQTSHSQETIMNQNVQPHSGAWVTFTYVSFSASAFMVAIGVFFLPLDLWIKGYLAMGIVMLVQSCVTLTKTVRDMHESGKLVNRIEDAKAERLLMEVSKAA